MYRPIYVANLPAICTLAILHFFCMHVRRDLGIKVNNIFNTNISNKWCQQQSSPRSPLQGAATWQI